MIVEPSANATHWLFALHSHEDFTRGAQTSLLDLVWQLTHTDHRTDPEAAFEKAVSDGVELFATILEQLAGEIHRAGPTTFGGLLVDRPEAMLAHVLREHAAQLREQRALVVPEVRPNLRRLALERAALEAVVRHARAATQSPGEKSLDGLRHALSHLNQIRSVTP